jgi:hypothetical protein
VSVARRRRVVDVGRESDEESLRSQKVPGQVTSVPSVSDARDVPSGTSSEGFVIDSCHAFEQHRREAAHRSLEALNIQLRISEHCRRKSIRVGVVLWLRSVEKFG